MANTVIQLKYSTVTATPTSLNVAEPAYSYVSNTLFIGTPGSDGVIAIGGQFYLDKFQRGFDAANSAGSYANSAFATANAGGSSASYANSAFAVANSSSSYANSAFAKANNEGGVNLTQNNNISAASSYANSAFGAANTADAKAVTSGSYANSAFAKANNEGEVNNTQNNNISAASSYANSAFLRANNSLNANAGGTVTGAVTITGDFTVSGNLVITGNTVTQNVSSLNIADPLIYLAANNYSSDSVDIGFAANYYDGANQRHTGLFRDYITKDYFVFDNYTPEPTANEIDTGHASFRIATLNANLRANLITLNGQNLQSYVVNSYNAANGAFAAVNSASSYANSAFAVANNEAGVNLTQNNNISAAASYANLAFAKANNEGGVNNTQNNNISAASSYANSGFAVANSGSSYANSAFARANTDVTNISTVAGQYGNATSVAAFTLEANGRISQANATTIAISASQVTSGTLSVSRGGTGATTFTTNGVLLGQGNSALTTVSSSTEGHVLTINNAGVPTFMHLQGGTF